MSRMTKVISHIIGVRKKADLQKGARKAADSQKKGSAKKKSVGTSVLDLSFLLVRSISFYRFSFGSGSTLYKNCGLGSVRVHQC